MWTSLQNLDFFHLQLEVVVSYVIICDHSILWFSMSDVRILCESFLTILYDFSQNCNHG